jgi:hypothetical protein
MADPPPLLPERATNTDGNIASSGAASATRLACVDERAIPSAFALQQWVTMSSHPGRDDDEAWINACLSGRMRKNLVAKPGVHQKGQKGRE